VAVTPFFTGFGHQGLLRATALASAFGFPPPLRRPPHVIIALPAEGLKPRRFSQPMPAAVMDGIASHADAMLHVQTALILPIRRYSATLLQRCRREEPPSRRTSAAQPPAAACFAGCQRCITLRRHRPASLALRQLPCHAYTIAVARDASAGIYMNSAILLLLTGPRRRRSQPPPPSSYYAFQGYANNISRHTERDVGFRCQQVAAILLSLAAGRSTRPPVRRPEATLHSHSYAFCYAMCS